MSFISRVLFIIALLCLIFSSMVVFTPVAKTNLIYSRGSFTGDQAKITQWIDDLAKAGSTDVSDGNGNGRVGLTLNYNVNNLSKVIYTISWSDVSKTPLPEEYGNKGWSYFKNDWWTGFGIFGWVAGGILIIAGLLNLGS